MKELYLLLFSDIFQPILLQKIVMSKKVRTCDVCYALCNSKILIGYCFVCNFDCIKFTPITPKFFMKCNNEDMCPVSNIKFLTAILIVPEWYD